MATSSFTKNFVVSSKNIDQQMDKMQDNTPTEVKGFTSKLINLKNISSKKDSKNDKQ